MRAVDISALEPAIERLYMAGKNDREIDEALMLPSRCVYRWRKQNDLPPNGERGYPPGEYAIYDAATEQLLALGTAEECSKVLGMTVGSFYCMVCRTASGKRKKYVVVKETSC